MYTAGSTFDTALKAQVGPDYKITSVKLIVGSSTNFDGPYGPYKGDQPTYDTGAYTVLTSYNPATVTWNSFGNGGVANTNYAPTPLAWGVIGVAPQENSDTTIWTFQPALINGWIADTNGSNKGLFFFTEPANDELKLLTTPSANVIWRITATSDCGPGIVLPVTPTALWQQLALPCVPATTTVGTTLGANTTGQLNASIYGNAGAGGWLMYGNDLVNNRNLQLGVNDTLTNGVGYWLKSFSTPSGGGNLTVSGTATPATVTQADGCASATGCAAVPVTTVAGSDRYNLVGNPFSYDVDWAKVRVRVKTNGGSLVGVYTPTEAQSAGYLSNQIWIYNGNTYGTWTDVSVPNPGNLKYFQSFWVKVLAAAYGYTVELLIPAEASTHGQVLPTAGALFASREHPWYLAWLDWLIPAAAADEMGFAPGPHPGPHAAPGARRGPAPIPPAAAITDPTLDLLITQGVETLGLDPTAAERAAHATARAEGREWYVRLLVDEQATGYQDHNSVLGQLLNAQAGYDPQDLLELPPFGTPYLTLVFPHPEWGARAGDYASDFRPAQRLDRRGRPLRGRPAADWAFEIRSDRPGTQVILRWEGDPAILQRTRLIDRTSGKTINPTAKAYANGYPVTLTKGTRAFTWRFLGTP